MWSSEQFPVGSDGKGEFVAPMGQNLTQVPDQIQRFGPVQIPGQLSVQQTLDAEPSVCD